MSEVQELARAVAGYNASVRAYMECLVAYEHAESNEKEAELYQDLQNFYQSMKEHQLALDEVLGKMQ